MKNVSHNTEYHAQIREYAVVYDLMPVHMATPINFLPNQSEMTVRRCIHFQYDINHNYFHRKSGLIYALVVSS